MQGERRKVVQGVPHRDGMLKACLQERKDQISAGCAKAMKKLKEG